MERVAKVYIQFVDHSFLATKVGLLSEALRQPTRWHLGDDLRRVYEACHCVSCVKPMLNLDVREQYARLLRLLR